MWILGLPHPQALIQGKILTSNGEVRLLGKFLKILMQYKSDVQLKQLVAIL